jgi:hypothetical protein
MAYVSWKHTEFLIVITGKYYKVSVVRQFDPNSQFLLFI